MAEVEPYLYTFEGAFTLPKCSFKPFNGRWRNSFARLAILLGLHESGVVMKCCLVAGAASRQRRCANASEVAPCMTIAELVVTAMSNARSMGTCIPLLWVAQKKPANEMMRSYFLLAGYVWCRASIEALNFQQPR
jgi:hypothetical protein